jgi:hypothetical protein
MTDLQQNGSEVVVSQPSIIERRISLCSPSIFGSCAVGVRLLYLLGSVVRLGAESGTGQSAACGLAPQISGLIWATALQGSTEP